MGISPPTVQGTKAEALNRNKAIGPFSPTEGRRRRCEGILIDLRCFGSQGSRNLSFLLMHMQLLREPHTRVLTKPSETRRILTRTLLKFTEETVDQRPIS